MKLICFCWKINSRKKRQLYLIFPYLVRIVRRRSSVSFNTTAKIHFCTHEKQSVSLCTRKKLLIRTCRTHKNGLRILLKWLNRKLCTWNCARWQRKTNEIIAAHVNISILVRNLKGHVCSVCDETFGIQSMIYYEQFHLVWWEKKYKFIQFDWKWIKVS